MNKKIWTWMLRFEEEDKVWEQSKDLIEMEFPSEVLDSVKFGEVPITRLDLTHKNCILFLFINKDCGESFKSGYYIGRDVQQYGEEYWKDILKTFKEADSKQI